MYADSFNRYSYNLTCCSRLCPSYLRYTEVASEAETQVKLQKLAANLKWYPLLFIFSWAFITVVRVMDWVGNPKPEWFTIVQVCS